MVGTTLHLTLHLRFAAEDMKIFKNIYSINCRDSKF